MLDFQLSCQALKLVCADAAEVCLKPAEAGDIQTV